MQFLRNEMKTHHNIFICICSTILLHQITFNYYLVLEMTQLFGKLVDSMNSDSTFGTIIYNVFLSFNYGFFYY